MGLLGQIFGETQAGSGSSTSPVTLALLALLAYRTYEGKGRLAEMLGRGQQPPGNAPAAQQPAGTGGLGALLSGGLSSVLSGGAAGGLFSGGLAGLLKQFQQNGQSDVANSWISNGPNKSVSPAELEQALGPDIVQTLSDHTGKSREDLLSELSSVLPEVVNKLTPDGRLPTENEAAKWS